MINGHVAFKTVYVRIFRGTDRMHKRDWVAISTWIGIALGLWIIAWIIAEAIPVFSNLLSLIVCTLLPKNDMTIGADNHNKTALFASWFTYGLSGIFWLYLNWGQYFSSTRKFILTIINALIVGIGACLVRLPFPSLSFLAFSFHISAIVLTACSAVWVSTSLGKLSMIIPAVRVSPARLAILDRSWF